MTNTQHNNNNNNDNNIITADNVQHIAAAITIKALETNYSKSGNNMIKDLLSDAIAYARDNSMQGGSGADLVQDTILYLWAYEGKSLYDTTSDGQTDIYGDSINILRGAFRNLRKIIYTHERKQYKQCYIVDYELKNGEIAIPLLWDMPTYYDFVNAEKILDSLELTKNQEYILYKRLQGYSLQAIAEKKGITKQAVFNALKKIGKKYIAIYGDSALYSLKK